MKNYFFRKTISYFLALACLLGTIERKTYAQFSYNNFRESPVILEVGGSIGIMNCYTDLGGNKGFGKPFIKDLNIGNSHLNGGIYFSALYKQAVGLRLEGTLGRVSAYDSILRSVLETTEGRYERNLHFRSSITELTLIAEFHPVFIFINWQKRYGEPPKLSPYIAAGIGYFSFNPRAKSGNMWIDLHPLTLEGQGFAEYPDRKPYKLTGINIPLGLGIKYELSPKVNVRAELIHRILSTDYLDDVSTNYIDATLFQNKFSGIQLANAIALSSNDRTNPGGPGGIFRKLEGGIRGNPLSNDAYFTFNFKFGISLR